MFCFVLFCVRSTVRLLLGSKVEAYLELAFERCRRTMFCYTAIISQFLDLSIPFRGIS